MKKLSFVCLLVALVLSACNSTENVVDSKVASKDNTGESVVAEGSQIISDASFAILKQHVTFEDNQFRLNLSKADALELGVTEFEYDETCKSIEAGNRMIQETMDECANDGREFSIKYDDNNDRV